MGRASLFSQEEREFALAVDASISQKKNFFFGTESERFVESVSVKWRGTAALFAPGDVDYLATQHRYAVAANVGSQQGGLLADGQILWQGEKDEQDPAIDLIYKNVNALIAAGWLKTRAIISARPD